MLAQLGFFAEQSKQTWRGENNTQEAYKLSII